VRRLLPLAALAGALALLAAPALAVDPAPALLDFEAPAAGTPPQALYPGSGAHLGLIAPGSFGPTGPCNAVEPLPGRTNAQGLDICPDYTLTISFDQLQSNVSLWATALGSFGDTGSGGRDRVPAAGLAEAAEGRRPQRHVRLQLVEGDRQRVVRADVEALRVRAPRQRLDRVARSGRPEREIGRAHV